MTPQTHPTQLPTCTPSGSPHGDASVQERVGDRHGRIGWRSEAWYIRQLAHVRECMAEADRVHTPEEIEAAWAALAVDPVCPQPELELR